MIYTVTLNPALDRELTVPEIRFNDVLRATVVRNDSGGKGFNVSRALHALGTETVALGFIGGETGARIARGLAELGIATDFIGVGGETRTNISIVSETAAHHIKVNEAGPTITPEEQAAMLAQVEALAHEGDWWVLSGSLPKGIAPDFYAQIVERVQCAGARAMLDTSGAPLKHACAARPFIAKPNAFEATELTGIPVTSPEDAGAAVAAIHDLGVENVYMSFGKAGALISDGHTCWFGAAPTIKERNPIGAGDCAVAGLMWGLSRGLPLPEALRWGIASGTTAASLPGTGVGDLGLVSSFFEQVVIRTLG
ncbi:MAG: 1-phosphofructokinase [Anaerolineae bacterium]|jgi:1-phosphofructokinase family hexose kinase|nr:1-phosphofructokinase [Anaerolineae bacterium]